jgi:glycosyltransferase involved in cell wall biosynthesis
MPTRNRRRLAAQAIRYFLGQDYGPRELVVVDDGDEPVEDLIPDDDRIRYLRLDRRLTLGAKRNLGCQHGRGELIAHWDDDDWMAPRRLSAQVADLLSTDADVCGLADLLHYHVEAGDAWLYRGPPSQPGWLAGCTLLYRRGAWVRRPFPEVDPGEGQLLGGPDGAGRASALSDHSLYVALIHRRNAARKQLGAPGWERRPIDAVLRLIEPEADFYVGLRNGRAAAPTPRPAAAGSITVAAPFAVADGYGSLAEYLVLGLARAGARINLRPIVFDPAGLTDELRALAERSRPEPDAPVLYFCWPSGELERFRGAGPLFINTMWESSRLPAAWVAPLDAARAVIVPTRFVARAGRESGVRAPIEVIPEGVDPAVYHLEERPDRPGLTTLIVSPFDPRKHVAEGVAAWKRAFADDPEARLIVKTAYHDRRFQPEDPRISYVDRPEPTRGIAHWYRQADVLLALGSEGFGLPLVEGMATGLPVVALNSEGQADVCAKAGDLVLSVDPVRWEPVEHSQLGDCGVRGVPGIDDVAARLRWVAEHRDEARALGRAASSWALRHRSIWAKGPAVLEAIERRAGAGRRLRRARSLWVPSWRTPCGVAEYSAHLAEALPEVAVTAGPPDLAATALLHVQHEYSLFPGPELPASIGRAREARVPVVVTQHTVAESGDAWEDQVDALVALTSAGAEALRAGQPGRPVEFIPPGCPAAVPPRKGRRGRVVGVFGFLAGYKGFWTMLDVLRALPDVELVMYSHARYPDIEARWSADAVGLPVRRIGDFLPVEEVAARLAAEADALAFWYDHCPQHSASYAVRIGLSTGVPVLASPTPWFRDLAAETFQPRDPVEGVRRLLEDTPLRDRLTAAAREYCHANSWSRIGDRHRELWRRLER